MAGANAEVAIDPQPRMPQRTRTAALSHGIPWVDFGAMRSLLLVLLGMLACGSAPPPRAEPVVHSKRDFTVRMETDRGEASMLVDGKERLRAAPNHGATITVSLTEGDHAVVLGGEPSEFGGMGIRTELEAGTTQVLSLACRRPCDDDRLKTWIAGLRAGAARLECAGAEVRDVSARTQPAGKFEVAFTIHVDPPMTAQDRAARGCL
jgi:hypothetical protein